MDMPNIPVQVTSHGPPQQFLQSDPSSDPSVAQAIANPAIIPEIPPKRKPGRPKGSTKKALSVAEPPPQKVKRPVGRPRKDGFPAGSVGLARVRPPKPHTTATPSASAPSASYYRPDSSWQTDVSMTGVSYPSHTGFTAVPIDPNLERDDWATLARTRPPAFLTTLLSALAAPNPVSSAGPTVEEAFKSHLVSLAPNPAQLQPIPSLYSILKTFWLPSSPAYFSLTASASTARTPSEHRFLYWDPQPLVFNGIPCPSCSSPLVNKGRISTGPVKVYDIEKPFFIIACEYVCKSPPCVTSTMPEGRKFASTDSSILRSLPIRLKDEFPAILMYGDADAGSGPNIWNWKALGVSLSLWNLVRACLRSGLRKEAILQLVNAVQRGVVDEGGEGDSAKKEGQGEEQADQATGSGGEEAVVDSPDHGGDSAPGGTAPPTSQEAPVDLQNNSFIKNFIEAYTANTASATLASSDNTASTSSTTRHHPTTVPSGSAQGRAFDFANYPYASYGFYNTPAPAGSSAPESASTSDSMKRPYPFGADDAAAADSSAQGESSKRSPRHCCKCGSQECKGKGGRIFCANPCQDCGKLDCKGRNSRRPDKKCSEGWL